MKVKILLFVISITLLSSCAGQHNIEQCLDQQTSYGFLHGLLHGCFSWFAFLGNLFGGDYAVYAINNTGGWYDFGFLLGIGSVSVPFVSMNKNEISISPFGK